ncbi:MAG TPA: WecB/TagA/CpsF family glycosyltransferase [Tepidisphaeraceae bacterium]|nr:WecB/TagA/CpsF family glycosyltransferase [Tepidisphaeraceae bacterium]
MSFWSLFDIRQHECGLYTVDVSSMVNAVRFLGCRFDSGSIEDAVSDVLAVADGRFRYLVTPNVHHMVKMLDDPATLKPLYERAWRVFCDSRVLSRLARFGGVHLPVITGSDLTAHMIDRAAKLGLTVALVGPTPVAGAMLEKRYDGLKVALHTPPMGFIASDHEIQKCVDFVVRTRAPLTFLGVGMPQQEILASRIADHPEARGVGLCIGASIDFLTGKQHRAPVWVQRAGLEWLHRLLSDPRRLASRYLIECPRIFYLVWWRYRKGQPESVS